MRTVYRKTERNGDTLDPASVCAGAVADGWLPHTARAMADLIAQGTSREAAATGRELVRLPYSRWSFERVGHEVGTLYWRAQAQIEEVLIRFRRHAGSFYHHVLRGVGMWIATEVDPYATLRRVK